MYTAAAEHRYRFLIEQIRAVDAVLGFARCEVEIIALPYPVGIRRAAPGNYVVRAALFRLAVLDTQINISAAAAVHGGVVAAQHR